MFEYFDVKGDGRAIDLAAGEMAFTVCQVPVVLHAAGPAHVEASGESMSGLMLDLATSAGIFERTGLVQRLDVFLAL